MNVLVLANALGTTSAMWDLNLRYWEPLRLVRSENTARNEVADLGRDLIARLDEQGIERASLCGLSLGGATAMWVAAKAPERVERLVLACTSARFGDPEPWHERAALVRAQGMDAIVDMLLGRWFTGRESAEILERFRQMLVSTPAEDYATLCEALAVWDFRDRLGEIRAPTLVIAGAEDPSTPPEHARLIADRVPGARLEVLEDARHLANVTWPERFATLVLEHIREEVRV